MSKPLRPTGYDSNLPSKQKNIVDSIEIKGRLFNIINKETDSNLPNFIVKGNSERKDRNMSKIISPKEENKNKSSFASNETVSEKSHVQNQFEELTNTENRNQTINSNEFENSLALPSNNGSGKVQKLNIRKLDKHENQSLFITLDGVKNHEKIRKQIAGAKKEVSVEVTTAQTEVAYEEDQDKDEKDAKNIIKQKFKNELKKSILKRNSRSEPILENENEIKVKKPKLGSKMKNFFNKIFSETTEMSWNGYHNIKEIENFLRQMKKKFPHLVKLMTIGTTCQDHSIKALKISRTGSYNDTIVIEAGIHAREWVTPATATYIINYLLTKWKDLPQHLVNKTWIFFPIVNPDGYHYTWTKERLWRKNLKKRAGSDHFGIDLNRNFSIGWEQNRHDDPGHLNYKGPRPFSERESRAIRDFLTPLQQYLKAYIALHTYGQEIRFHWCLPEEIPELQRVGKVAELGAKKMSRIHNEFYSVGKPRNNSMFGNSRDWARKSLGIKYSYLIELRDRGKNGFLLPENEIIPTAEEALEFIATVAMAIDQDKEYR